MAGDYDDVNSPEFKEAMNRATAKPSHKEYQPTEKEKQLIVKLAQISPKMYRNIRNGLTMMLSQGTEQQRAAAQKYIDVMNQVERENPDLKKAVNNPPQLSDAEQRAKDMEFLRYYAQEFPNEFNEMIGFLDFYKSSPLIQSYVSMMREVQQNQAQNKPAESRSEAGNTGRTAPAADSRPAATGHVPTREELIAKVRGMQGGTIDDPEKVVDALIAWSNEYFSYDEAPNPMQALNECLDDCINEPVMVSVGYSDADNPTFVHTPVGALQFFMNNVAAIDCEADLRSAAQLVHPDKEPELTAEEKAARQEIIDTLKNMTGGKIEHPETVAELLIYHQKRLDKDDSEATLSTAMAKVKDFLQKCNENPQEIGKQYGLNDINTPLDALYVYMEREKLYPEADISTARTEARSATNENNDDDKGFLYISDNVEHALKMGPTVIKEYLEGLGIEFPESIIRHNSEGGEYIPTRLLRQWFENNRLTEEQMNKLNALVDDRAAFDAKVREINERDHYEAPSSQQAEAEQSAEQGAKTDAVDVEKLKQYAAKGNMMTDPAIWREMKEKDPELYATFQRTMREYLNPSKAILVDDTYNAISEIAGNCAGRDKHGMSKILDFAQNVMNITQEIDNGNRPKSEEKKIEESINVSGDKVYKVSGYGSTGTIDGDGLIDGTYTVRDLQNGKYEVTFNAPDNHYQTSRTYFEVNLNNSASIPPVMRALTTETRKLQQQQKEAQEAQKKQEDIEKMRELMRNNPKKFQDVKNAYKAALKSDSKTITEQASYYLALIEDVEKDEATKEKVKQERERAIKKLEKEIKKLEKQAKKLREKGEKEKADKMKQEADEKRETLEKMRKDGENVKPDEKGKTDAKPEAAKAQEHAVEQRIIDSRRNGGNSIA